MIKMMKNKKGLDFKDVMKWALVLIFFVMILVYGRTLIAGVTKTGVQTVNLLGDEDSDSVANKFDICCAVPCNPQGEAIDDNPDSEWRGCTEEQGYTNCTSSVCNFDYDHDHVSNNVDQCCAKQCKPLAGESVDKNCPGQRCGCAKSQTPTACDADPAQYPCNQNTNTFTNTP